MKSSSEEVDATGSRSLDSQVYKKFVFMMCYFLFTV